MRYSTTSPERKRIERELEDLNRYLEFRIEQRTSDLAEALHLSVGTLALGFRSHTCNPLRTLMPVIHSPVGAIAVTMQCTFSTDNDTLSVVVSGTDVCAADVRRLVDDIAEAASRDGLLRVLCDATHLRHGLSFPDVLGIAKYAVHRAPVQGKFAVVCAPDDREKASFMETVVVHLGKSARVFSDATTARSWLDDSPALEGHSKTATA